MEQGMAPVGAHGGAGPLSINDGHAPLLAQPPQPPHAADTMVTMEGRGTTRELKELTPAVKEELYAQLRRIEQRPRNCCKAFFCGICACIPAMVTCIVAGMLDCCLNCCEDKGDMTRGATQAVWEFFLPPAKELQKQFIQSYRITYAISHTEEDSLLDPSNYRQVTNPNKTL